MAMQKGEITIATVAACTACALAYCIEVDRWCKAGAPLPGLEGLLLPEGLEVLGLGELYEEGDGPPDVLQ